MSSHVAVEPTPPSHSPAPAAHPTHAERGETRRPWTVFALMIAAQFMVILDVSVVNVALPSISRGLHLTASDYQWVVSVYRVGGGPRASPLLLRRIRRA